MLDLSFSQQLAVWSLPVLFAITLHEVAHGWMAEKCGDKTARMLGRISLNPIKHIDWVGTVILPALLLMMGGILFGWAKPVPVNPANFRRRDRDQVWVALAGPAANFLMALFWLFCARLGVWLLSHNPGMPGWMLLVYMGLAGIKINLLIGVLNLLPIPPLDGAKVVSVLLPRPWSVKYEAISPYGLVIVLLLLASGILGMLMSGPLSLLYGILTFLLRLGL